MAMSEASTSESANTDSTAAPIPMARSCRVVSDLALEVSRLPRNVYLGNLPDFSASMTEAGVTITKADFLKIVDVSVTVRSRTNKKRWKKSLSKNMPAPSEISTLPIPDPHPLIRGWVSPGHAGKVTR